MGGWGTGGRVGARDLYYVNCVARSGIMAPGGAVCVPKNASFCFTRTVGRLGTGSFLLMATLTSASVNVIRSVQGRNVSIGTLRDARSIYFRGVCKRGRGRHARHIATGTSPFAIRNLGSASTQVVRLNDLLTSSFSLRIVGFLSKGKLLSMSIRKFLHGISGRGILTMS